MNFSRHPPREAKQIGPEYTLRARPAAMAGVSSQGSTLVQTLKPAVKAKPGKQAPTAEERRWLDWVAQQPCCVCSMWTGRRPIAYNAVQVHHILRANRRIGHLHTIPLCPWHHQDHQAGRSLGYIARHPWKARFEAAYSTEAELLETLRERYRLNKFVAV